MAEPFPGETFLGGNAAVCSSDTRGGILQCFDFWFRDTTVVSVCLHHVSAAKTGCAK
jgi:hypothetical protein